MADTKPDTIAKLEAAGIQHDPEANHADLKALLKSGGVQPDPNAGKDLNAAMPDTSAPKPNADTSRAGLNLPTSYDDIANMPEDTLEQRFEKFLAKARHQRPDKKIFDQQKAKGEFDTIPQTFVEADAATQAAK